MLLQWEFLTPCRENTKDTAKKASIITPQEQLNGERMSIGENIKRLRRDKGLNQGELADRSGLGVNIISKIERNDSNPKASTIYKLMEALDCTSDRIFVDAEKSNMTVVMKTMFERASDLPEENKRVLVDLIDKYCKAIAYDEMLSEKHKLFGFIPPLIKGKTEDVLKKQD